MEAGNEYKIAATVVTCDVPKSATVWILSGFRSKRYEMVREAAYTYSVTILNEEMNEGFLRYYIILDDGTEVYTFPQRHTGQPVQLDLSEATPYEVEVLATDHIYLFKPLQTINISTARGGEVLNWCQKRNLEKLPMR